MLTVDGEFLVGGVIRLIRQFELNEDGRKFGGVCPDGGKQSFRVYLFLSDPRDRVIIRISPEEFTVSRDEPVLQLGQCVNSRGRGRGRRRNRRLRLTG